jgi:hypothetical protein
MDKHKLGLVGIVVLGTFSAVYPVSLSNPLGTLTLGAQRNERGNNPTPPAGATQNQGGSPFGTSPTGAAAGTQDHSLPYSLPKNVRAIGNGQFNITSARPMAVAAQLLSQRVGVPISYEDAAWNAPSDVEPATLPAETLKKAPPNYRVPLVPRTTSFEFSLPSIDEIRNVGNPEATIRSVIETYHRYGNPGRFKLLKFGDGEYSIVAESAGDKNGRMVAQQLPLDTVISFPAETRSINLIIEVICQAVSAAGGTQLSNASPADMYSVNTFTDMGATNEKARDVLSRVLRLRKSSAAPKVDWQIYSNPGTNTAFLSFYDSLVELKRADGTVRLQPQMWKTDSLAQTR